MNIKYLILTSSALCLIACGKKDEAKPAETNKTEETKGKTAEVKVEKPKAAAAMEMANLDVVYEDFKATISAPVGATFEESYGTLEVKLADGKDFFLQIDTDAPDMAAVKAEVEKNDVQKLVKIHTETPEVLVYETEAFGKTSFWLNSAVKV